MKINDKHVIKELGIVKSNISDAYTYSNNSNCERLLAKAFGRLDALISILTVVEEDE